MILLIKLNGLLAGMTNFLILLIIIYDVMYLSSFWLFVKQ